MVLGILAIVNQGQNQSAVGNCQCTCDEDGNHPIGSYVSGSSGGGSGNQNVPPVNTSTETKSENYSGNPTNSSGNLTIWVRSNVASNSLSGGGSASGTRTIGRTWTTSDPPWSPPGARFNVKFEGHGNISVNGQAVNGTSYGSGAASISASGSATSDCTDTKGCGISLGDVGGSFSTTSATTISGAYSPNPTGQPGVSASVGTSTSAQGTLSQTGTYTISVQSPGCINDGSWGAGVTSTTSVSLTGNCFASSSLIQPFSPAECAVSVVAEAWLDGTFMNFDRCD